MFFGKPVLCLFDFKVLFEGKERAVMEKEKVQVAVQPDYQNAIAELVRGRYSPGVLRDRLSD